MAAAAIVMPLLAVSTAAADGYAGYIAALAPRLARSIRWLAIGYAYYCRYATTSLIRR